jgi:hypothetical protein
MIQNATPNRSEKAMIKNTRGRNRALTAAVAGGCAAVLAAALFAASVSGAGRPADAPSVAACEARMRADLAEHGRVDESAPECAGLGDLADIEERVLFGTGDR